MLLLKRRKRNMHCDRSLLYCVSIDGFVHKFVHLLRIFVPCSCVFFLFCYREFLFFIFFPSIFIFEPIRRLHWNAKLIISNLQCSFVMMVVVWRQQVLSLVPCREFNFGRNEYHFDFNSTWFPTSAHMSYPKQCISIDFKRTTDIYAHKIIEDCVRFRGKS